MDINTRIHPGDQITALGLTFTVWYVLYQDHCGGFYDVEFIDDQDRYHHWKECYDGGSVTRSGIPGTYYRETSGAAGGPVIACIRPRRVGKGYTARVIYRSGPEIFLGSHSTPETALAEINRYSSTYRLVWKEM